jgi:hypothetical protein
MKNKKKDSATPFDTGSKRKPPKTTKVGKTEFEEQRSMNIRMKPQPLNTPKKKEE